MGATGEIRQKLGLEFEKEGWARYYSHHDLMRFFERAMRRADLPVRLTSGFNPKPRMVFLTALGLGVNSKCEHLEIEFTQPIAPEEVAGRLDKLMLPGMRVIDSTRLPKRRKGRQVESVTYELGGFTCAGASSEDLETVVNGIAAAQTLKVQRFSKKSQRTVEIAPSIESLRIEGDIVQMVIRNLPGGMARPDEITKMICQQCGILPSGISITKRNCQIAW
ncbi:MAG: DUF2344 domain-containing protein [Planctomycetes bacterium]|nr:DUF2344 domain-containing protein [Planctomycetota bacterium]